MDCQIIQPAMQINWAASSVIVGLARKSTLKHISMQVCYSILFFSLCPPTFSFSLSSHLFSLCNYRIACASILELMCSVNVFHIQYFPELLLSLNRQLLLDLIRSASPILSLIQCTCHSKWETPDTNPLSLLWRRPLVVWSIMRFLQVHHWIMKTPSHQWNFQILEFTRSLSLMWESLFVCLFVFHQTAFPSLSLPLPLNSASFLPLRWLMLVIFGHNWAPWIWAWRFKRSTGALQVAPSLHSSWTLTRWKVCTAWQGSLWTGDSTVQRLLISIPRKSGHRWENEL